MPYSLSLVPDGRDFVVVSTGSWVQKTGACYTRDATCTRVLRQPSEKVLVGNLAVFFVRAVCAVLLLVAHFVLVDALLLILAGELLVRALDSRNILR